MGRRYDRLDRAGTSRRARAQTVEGDSFAALECRLQRNHSLREALEYVEPEEVPDGTTFWRAFDALEPAELRECL